MKKRSKRHATSAKNRNPKRKNAKGKPSGVHSDQARGRKPRKQKKRVLRGARKTKKRAQIKRADERYWKSAKRRTKNAHERASYSTVTLHASRWNRNSGGILKQGTKFKVRKKAKQVKSRVFNAKNRGETALEMWKWVDKSKSKKRIYAKIVFRTPDGQLAFRSIKRDDMQDEKDLNERLAVLQKYVDTDSEYKNFRLAGYEIEQVTEIEGEEL